MQKKIIFGLVAGSLVMAVLCTLLTSASTLPSGAWNSKGVLRVEIADGLEYSLVPVEGSTFWMGSANGDSDEKPRHRVTVDNFFIGEFEVTQQLWEQVMYTNPSRFVASNHPVENVSWNDCQEFIKRMNRRRIEINLGEYSSWRFRLPTEAEWEYAARGGNKTRGYKYAGSNDIGSVAWYRDNSGDQTLDVGSKTPNELGLYDMSGNVWEWCFDWCDESYYKNSPQSNPRGPSSGSFRVLRGGGWESNASNCRVAYRDSRTSNFRDGSRGLRLVLAPFVPAPDVIHDNNAVDVPASFPGGDVAMRQFIEKNIVYPEIAIENGLQGTVILRFKVDVDGSLSTVSVKKSLSRECDKAAMDVFHKLPKFTPAKINGHPVPVWITVPVKFAMQ